MNSRRAGFTILETVLTVSIFTVLMAAFITSFSSFSTSTEQSSREYSAAEKSLKAVQAITQDLSRSGFTNVAGVDYPLIFAAGDPGGGQPAAFAHAPADASAGSQLVSNSVVFTTPADADNDGWPDLDANRAPVWQATTVAFVLVPDGRGTNTLQRRTSDGGRRVLARNVASLTFESPADTAFAIPLDTLRVRIELAVSNTEGATITRSSEAVVRLRNGRFP